MESTHLRLGEPDRLDAEVTAWRLRQLRAAGVEPPLDRALARDARIDLHAVIGLIERGCPPGLALRILAPLDETGASR